MDSAIVRAAGRESPTVSSFRRFALVLLGFVTLPPLLLGAFVIAVDPYYVFGSPSVRWINVVRPYYETNIFSAKLSQTRRMRPGAVALGSSRVEVGLDPRHPGWADSRSFNFALPGSTSYEIMLAFLHAQAVGRPLKQAVVGLDFFGFNIFFPRSRTQQEAPFGRDATRAFAEFLANEFAQRRPILRAPRTRNLAPASRMGTSARARNLAPSRSMSCSPRKPTSAKTTRLPVTGTRPDILPPIPRPASRSRSAPFRPVTSTMSLSVEISASWAAFRRRTPSKPCGCVGRS